MRPLKKLYRYQTLSARPDVTMMKHWRQMNEWSNIPTAGLSSCGCSSIIQSASVFTLKHVLSASTQYEVILVHVHITSWHTAGSQSTEQWIYNRDIRRFISSPRSSHLHSVIITTLIILHPIILLFQPQNFSFSQVLPSIDIGHLFGLISWISGLLCGFLLRLSFSLVSVIVISSFLVFYLMPLISHITISFLIFILLLVSLQIKTFLCSSLCVRLNLLDWACLLVLQSKSSIVSNRIVYDSHITG